LRHLIFGLKLYEIFELEPRLDLDPKDLEKRFYALSRKLHPDVAGAQSMDPSAALNDAYRTLKEPVARANYFLKEHGIEIGEGNLPPEMLEEMFELNMALEEGDPSAGAQLDSMLASIDTELQRLFQSYDSAPSSQALNEVRATLNRRKYISNLIRVHSRLFAAQS
jgi:molecular chaperone HscB